MYIVDTNVVAELRKVRLGRADKNVASWVDSVSTIELFLSVITIQELEIGVLLAERRDPKQGMILRKWFNHQVLPVFAGRILPVDLVVAQCSAKLHVPNPRPIRDGLIAATALVHGMTVVTRNIADFEPTGACVINPWRFVPMRET